MIMPRSPWITPPPKLASCTFPVGLVGLLVLTSGGILSEPVQSSAMLMSRCSAARIVRMRAIAWSRCAVQNATWSSVSGWWPGALSEEPLPPELPWLPSRR